MPCRNRDSSGTNNSSSEEAEEPACTPKTSSQKKKKKTKKIHKKGRSENFSSNEESVILNEVEKYQKILFSKFQAGVTNIQKQKTWEVISKKVNALGIAVRTAKQVKKKWDDMKQKAKKNLLDARVHFRKTGGGEAMESEVDPLQDRILAICGKTACSGITGGFDTMDMSKHCEEHNEEEAGAKSDDDDIFTNVPVRSHDDSLEACDNVSCASLTLSQVIEASQCKKKEETTAITELKTATTTAMTGTELSHALAANASPSASAGAIEIDDGDETPSNLAAYKRWLVANDMNKKADKKAEMTAKASKKKKSKAEEQSLHYEEAQTAILDMEQERLDIEKRRLQAVEETVKLKAEKLGVLKAILNTQIQMAAIQEEHLNLMKQVHQPTSAGGFNLQTCATSVCTRNTICNPIMAGAENVALQQMISASTNQQQINQLQQMPSLQQGTLILTGQQSHLEQHQLQPQMQMEQQQELLQQQEQEQQQQQQLQLQLQQQQQMLQQQQQQPVQQQQQLDAQHMQLHQNQEPQILMQTQQQEQIQQANNQHVVVSQEDIDEAIELEFGIRSKVTELQ